LLGLAGEREAGREQGGRGEGDVVGETNRNRREERREST